MKQHTLWNTQNCVIMQLCELLVTLGLILQPPLRPRSLALQTPMKSLQQAKPQLQGIPNIYNLLSFWRKVLCGQPQ